MQKVDILGYILLFIIFCICVYIYFDNDEFQLKCIVSTVDGNKYCVRERAKLELAADLLANTTQKLKQLVAYLGEKYPNKENCKRLVENFNPTKVKQCMLGFLHQH